jgi:hypothetical protein
MAKEKRDIGLIQVKLRLPIALHRKLVREADRRGQTLNAEILARLAQSFETERALGGAESALSQARDSIKELAESVKMEIAKSYAERLETWARSLEPKEVRRILQQVSERDAAAEFTQRPAPQVKKAETND